MREASLKLLLDVEEVHRWTQTDTAEERKHSQTIFNRTFFMIPIGLEKSTLVITDLYDRVRQLFDPSLHPSRFSQKSGTKEEEAHLPAPKGDISPGRLFYNLAPGTAASPPVTVACTARAVHSGS